jgi:hypothetical protein
MADHPTGIFEFPIVGQANEGEIFRDVGEKGELPATEGAVIPLAVIWP